MPYPTILSFDKIPGLLMKYSWAAKMEVCARYSKQTMWHGRVWQSDTMKTAPTPWELNQFAALATIYGDGRLEGFDDAAFRQIINCFRNAPVKNRLRSIDDAKQYLSYEAAMVQFPYQVDALVLFFRYRYLFSFVDDAKKLDMPRLFLNTFQVSNEEVAFLSVLSFIASSQDEYWIQFLREFCSQHHMAPTARFGQVVDLFSIDRTEYAKKESCLIEFSTDGIANALNLMEIRPFIKMKDSYFLPLPFLLNFATTRHLFDRLVDENRDLRSKVGRTAMEAYVFKLFTDSGCYDAVEREFKYRRGNDRIDSPDVIVKKGEEVVFIEVKLAEAPIVLRQLNQSVIDKTIGLAAKHVFQVYSRVNEIVRGFAKPRMVADFDHSFCVVVVHEDSYTVRDEIYKRCFAEHPELSESEREFIRTRITLTSLYDVEKFCYRHRSILPALRKRLQDEIGNEAVMLDTEVLAGGDIDLPFDELMTPLVEKMTKSLFRPCA